MEVDYLKKKTSELKLYERKCLIDRNETLPLSNQFELLEISPSSYYYEPREESALNLKITELIDKQHMLDPVRFGQMKMKKYIEKKLKIGLNRKRIQRLMRLMGVEGDYEKRKTTV